MRSLIPLFTVLAAAAALAACDGGDKPHAGPTTTPSAKTSAAAATSAKPASAAKVFIDPEELKKLKPLPARFDSEKNPTSEAKVKLGRMLYFEPRLSKNHDVSCNSCHDLAAYGVDGKPTSPGHKGQLGSRNSPTVYNAGVHFVQFWDGRAETLEDQAKGPVLNPVEMAMPSPEKVVEVLKSITEYVDAFKAAFPDDKEPVSYHNMAVAIGAFERGLSTPSRFDKFLGGDQKALTDDERAGLAKFIEVGCQTCHDGAALGGTTYQKLGKEKEFPNLKDQGRYEHTKKDGDKAFFKVPGLRNIDKTAPYYHDGSIKTLEEATENMAWHQLGKKLKPEETKSIVTFLKALTGDLPGDYIKKPELPPNGKKTPKPDPT